MSCASEGRSTAIIPGAPTKDDPRFERTAWVHGTSDQHGMLNPTPFFVRFL
jgi:hypothetical protein